MKRLDAIAAVVLSLSAFAFADESGLLDKDTGTVTKSSRYSVKETIGRVEAEAKGVGANIFNCIDYQEMSKHKEGTPHDSSDLWVVRLD